MSHRRHSSLLAAALLSVPALAACGVIPGAPDEGPTAWIPSTAPSPSLSPLPTGEYGFTPAEEAAVRIRNSGCSALESGSGFAIDDHTIITNHHVIADYDKLAITTSDGRDLTVASVATTTVADLAILTTVESMTHYVTLSDADPTIGDPVTVVGFPEGGEMTTTTGTILSSEADQLDNADHVFLTSAASKPGSSGSAAYGPDGTVFGVLYAGEGDTGRGIIIPISLLREALVHPEPVAPSCSY